ncbi:MAG: putative DNA binding domain-containing protein [Candidatus Pacebacteria bacterium]|nr:putative DNA binding domain-containing protein [Candidatus Paceibacterota bacterium]
MDNKYLKKLINELIESGESETIEFKENNFSKIEIGKRISALANSVNLVDKKKAYLIFGISDEKEIVGTEFKPKTEKIGSEFLESWLNQMLTPKTDFYIYELYIDNKNIIIFEISPAITQPIKFQNIAYIRISSTTRKLSDFSEKERKIWQNIDKKSFGQGIAKENLTVSEVLDLLDYAKFFSLTKQELPLETKKFIDKMAEYNLVIKNFEDDFDITNLGAILFAKDLSKFSNLKRKAPRVVIYEGVSRNKVNKKQDGNLGYAVAFENLIDFINDKLPSNEEITRTLRIEKKMYPEIAIREFIANALIHQDFTISGTSPIVEIFDDRVEISNPGMPLIDTDRFIDHAPISRNEDLASFMRQIGFCEELGSGIDRALGEITIYQLPAPKFEAEDNSTRVILYSYKELNDMTTDDKIRACYQHAVLKRVENSKMTNTTLRERLGIEKQNYSIASRIIADTIRAGKIKESEKSKEYVPWWV